ncbi:MAG: hypothetical protein HF978_20080 [Desulfobacteraceae bacterium]|nr:hypothetical protein [Desulfobacteraceae bacterium]MBC2757846.1 hypothetical protein [Desulfobacteraceae bacterium]
MNMTAFLTIPSIAVLLDFIRGPLVWLSFIIFGLGLIVQTFRLLNLTQKKETRRLAPGKEFVPQATLSKRECFFRRLAFLKITIIGQNACMVMFSFLFHVCLVITPIFLLGHNVLLDTSFGFSFISFSEKTSDTLTLIVLMSGLVFLLRRLLLPRVRILTTVYDFILLFVAIAPFLTGYLAHHHIFNYNIMIILHILSGELMLVMIPFSKFFHMVFFFISRFMIISEHSMGAPKRSWQF